MSPPIDPSGLSRAELEGQFVELLRVVSELKLIVAAQRDEIARLKGLKGRPVIKPSGMDKGTQRKPSGKPGKHRGRGKVTPRGIIEIKLLQVAVPAGSQFKGYEPYQVQELVLSAQLVRYRRERWLTPSGETIVAPLPGGIRGHFGPELRRFVLMQYHQGQVTVERLVAQLQAFGVSISKRQVMRLLIDQQDAFLDETIEVLRAGHTDYVINDAALDYMREHDLAGPVLQQLAAHPQRQFADHSAWTRHLEQLGIACLQVTPDPVRVATEGALWGAVSAHGFLCEAVIVSHDAGQFDVGTHALCWIHAERLVHELETFTDQRRAAQQQVRGLIWWLYADLKAYRHDPTRCRRAELAARFDRIFQRQTGFATLDRLLRRLHANKAELLMVLNHPEIALHTNKSENDIRCQVTKRHVSGGTHSAVGRDCRDAFLGLAKTCGKLGIAFFDDLGARIGGCGSPTIPPLADLIRCRGQPA
jgi:hypothetical protein